VSEQTIDRLARRASGPIGKRRLLQAGGVALAALALGNEWGRAKPGQNERKRCHKRGQKCKRAAAAYCAQWWPKEMDSCQYDFNQCCSHLSKCEKGKSNKCMSHLHWT
jgi:hypothetical protein